MSKPLLIMFVGIPGSGKTTFARQLARELHAVVLNSDAIRISMWGSRDAVRATHSDSKERAFGNQLTFGAMDYATEQILQTGYSVVYDCNANHRWERDKSHEIAKKHGATSVVVRRRVPYQCSLQRVQERDETHDQLRISAEKAEEVLQRFTKEIEEPTADENVIEISGEATFQDQYKEFLRKIT